MPRTQASADPTQPSDSSVCLGFSSPGDSNPRAGERGGCVSLPAPLWTALTGSSCGHDSSLHVRQHLPGPLQGIEATPLAQSVGLKHVSPSAPGQTSSAAMTRAPPCAHARVRVGNPARLTGSSWQPSLARLALGFLLAVSARVLARRATSRLAIGQAGTQPGAVLGKVLQLEELSAAVVRFL